MKKYKIRLTALISEIRKEENLTSVEKKKLEDILMKAVFEIPTASFAQPFKKCPTCGRKIERKKNGREKGKNKIIAKRSKLVRR